MQQKALLWEAASLSLECEEQGKGCKHLSLQVSAISMPTECHRVFRMTADGH